VADSGGNKLQRYVYGAFGTLENIKDASGNDITGSPVLSTSYAFACREWDGESGFYFLRNRVYDPSTGRFLQKDPEPGKISSSTSVINSYAYTFNNPMLFSDPNGKFGFLLAALYVVAQSAIVAGAVTAIQIGLSGGDFSWSNFRDRFYPNFAVIASVSVAGLAIMGSGSAASYQIQNGFMTVQNASLASGAQGASFGLTIGASGSGTIAADLFLHEVGHMMFQFLPMVGAGSYMGYNWGEKHNMGGFAGGTLGGLAGAGAYGAMGGYSFLGDEVPFGTTVRGAVEGSADILPAIGGHGWYELATPFGL